jgi:iron(III) transport system substrate-binding protein
LITWQSAVRAANIDLIDAAKREARVVLYTVVAESQVIANQFEKKYPSIKVDVVRATAYPLLNRILNEARADTYNYDVVLQTPFPMELLVQRNLVQPYRSPEREAYRPAWKDKDGYWTSVDDLYLVIGYNTKSVTEENAPRDWRDLLKPKWKGKIGMDPDNYLLYGGLEQKWGKTRAVEYFKRLAGQDIQFRNGNTLLAQLVAAGEYPIAFLYAHRVEYMKNQGASIDWVATMDPIITVGDPIALASKPNHPNAGKLLIDFILSREGQVQLQRLNRIPSRADLDPISSKLDSRKLKLFPLAPSLASREPEWRRVFRGIFDLTVTQ